VTARWNRGLFEGKQVMTLTLTLLQAAAFLRVNEGTSCLLAYLAQLPWMQGLRSLAFLAGRELDEVRGAEGDHGRQGLQLGALGFQRRGQIYGCLLETGSPSEAGSCGGTP